jgi:hypothetical protein
MANPTFDMENVVRSVISRADAFVSADAGPVALAIYGTIFLFHLIEGAAELSQTPSSCRLFHGRFWLRMALVGALLAGYRPIVIGSTLAIQPRVMLKFAGSWGEIWQQENASLEEMRRAESENRDVKFTEVATSKAGKDDDSWYAKLGKYVLDGIYTGLGWVLSVIGGLLITILILMEGFFALGVNTLLIALGPLCVAFAAHPKTEGLFWAFMKGFLVFGLLYMPILGLACSFGGVIMARITKMAVGSDIAYGDGSDLGVHMVMSIVGPLCALAVVRSAPGVLSTVIGAASLGTGGGGAYDQGARMAGAAARWAGTSSGGAKVDEAAGSPGIGGGMGVVPDAGDGGPAGGEIAEGTVPTDTAKEMRGE